MNIFLQLTTPNDQRVWIAISSIERLMAADGASGSAVNARTVLWIGGNVQYVRETVDEIIDRVSESASKDAVVR